MARFTVPYSKECAYPDRHAQGTCNIAHERMALEAKCIRRALRELKTDGWLPYAVWDGQDRFDAETENDVLIDVFTVDTSIVHVRNAEGKRSWFNVILGNGIDVVGGDYGASIDAPMTRAYDIVSEWE